jgi:hypothetical protein
MRVLCIGDVFAKPGRQALRALLPSLIDRHRLDFVVANAENAAGGVGLTLDTAKEILALPVNVLTSGNHIWKHREIIPLLDREPRILRPLNYPEPAPGRGCGLFETAAGEKIGVVIVMGRVFMEPLPNPFTAASEAAARLRQETRVILVELHAEATSEKRAMGWYLDGKVSAVYGTHTHVPTADEEVLPGGTGYITDLGMTGPHDSIIGMRKEEVLERFLSQRPSMYVAAKRDPRLNGAVFDIDPETGRTRSVQRICERVTP